MRGKPFFWCAGIVVVAMVLFFSVRALTAPSELPSGVSTTIPSVTSVVPTTKKSPTVTKTTTVFATPTETFHTMSPRPSTTTSLPPVLPVGCVQDGMNTADWDTDDDIGNGRTMVTGPVTDLYPSPGECFDTIVFDINTQGQPGFVARYVPQVTYDGSGEPVPLFGLADIQLSIFAPIDNYELWNGYEFVTGSEYGSLRNIKFAGSFEGVTSFGIGVKDKVPFAVDYVSGGSAGTGKVIVRLAHE